MAPSQKHSILSGSPVRSRLAPLVIAFVIALGLPLGAQNNQPTESKQGDAAAEKGDENEPPDGGEELLGDWSDGLRVFGLIRIRPEYRHNYDFDKSTDDSVEFAGQSTQFGVEKRFSERVKMVILLQDARVWGAQPGSDTGVNTANDETSESTDIRAAWFEVQHLIGPVGLRAGRQVLHFGDGRLVANGNWFNAGRSFDGLRFNYATPGGFWKADAWAAVLAEEDADGAGNGTAVGSGNSSGFRFTCDATTGACSVTAGTARELNDAYFTGFYNEFNPAEFLRLDLYYMGVHKKWIPAAQPIVQGPGVTITTQDRDRQRDNLYTFGGRITNRTKEDKVTFLGLPIDFGFEYARQYGVTGERIDAKWDYLNQRVPKANLVGVPTGETEAVYKEKRVYDAFAFAADAGFTFWRLRLGAEYDRASGDRDRTDAAYKTFNNLFPNNHEKYGQADLAGWRNMVGRSVNGTLNMGKYGTLRLEYWEISKATAQDAWYVASGAARTGVSTESVGDARFGDQIIDGVISRGAGVLSRKLFREYDLSYTVNIKGAGWNVDISAGFSRVLARAAVADVRNDVFTPIALQTPTFDPRADFGYLLMAYKF